MNYWPVRRLCGLFASPVGVLVCGVDLFVVILSFFLVSRSFAFVGSSVILTPLAFACSCWITDPVNTRMSSTTSSVDDVTWLICVFWGLTRVRLLVRMIRVCASRCKDPGMVGFIFCWLLLRCVLHLSVHKWFLKWSWYSFDSERLSIDCVINDF